MLQINVLVIFIAISKTVLCSFDVQLNTTSGSGTYAACGIVPWTKPSGTGCVCLDDKYTFDGKLKCDENTQYLSVLDCYCMTYDPISESIDVGACVQNCMKLEQHLEDALYHCHTPPQKNSLPSINEKMCEKKFNRAGRLCGKCLPGFSPLAYSYNLTCVNCTEGNRNMWKYFVFSLPPTTLFFFIILFFKINTTSSHLHGFVIFAQALVLPEFGRLIILTLDSQPNLENPVKFLGSLFCLWNLDFLKMFDWGICLDMQPLSVRALDYTIAVYPFILSAASYILIELHDRNVRIIVLIWRPFRWIFTLFRRNWDIRTSIIDAYATFFQLSCFKTLCISFDLLIPTYVYTVGPSESDKDTTLVLYYDGTVDFFGEEHLPYAVLAITFLLVFTILPIVILCIYPCGCFQYVLNHFNLNFNIVRAFMDSINGCYKDGTEQGTRDYRWFAAVDILSRLILFLVFLFTRGSLYFPLGTIVILFIILLLSHVQPHKKSLSHYTKIDVTFYCLLALYYTALNSTDIATVKARQFTMVCFVISLVVAFIPLLYITCLSVYWIVTRAQRRCLETIISRIRPLRIGYDNLEDSLADRVMNPDQYARDDTDSIAVSSKSRIRVSDT